MNILVAVDLSDATAKVIEAARGVAKLTGVKIFVLHVAEPDPDFIGYEAGPDAVRRHITEALHHEQTAVQALAEDLREEGLEASGLLILGPTVDTTLKEADRLGAGLIVIGSHGHGALYDALVGSYSAGIIRKSKLPVLVVPVKDS